MDNTLLAALIGAFTTIIAPVVTLSFKRRLDRKANARIALQNNNIIGKWVGNTKQQLRGIDVEFDISFLFDLDKDNKLTGRCAVNLSDTQLIALETFIINGGLYNDRFLKIEYNNNDPKVMQFGYFLLEYSPLGNSLDGNFLGYGPESNAIICGQVFLKKVH